MGVQRSIVLSSGPILKNPNTTLGILQVLNVDPRRSKDVIVQILDWSTCPPTELPKSANLCGEPVPSGTNSLRILSPSPPPSPPPFPILTPLFVTIPPVSRLDVLFPPPTPAIPADPIYEIRIFHPTDPINLLVNAWGVNELNIPQEGNTILNRQFFPPVPLNLIPPNPV